MTVEVYKKTTMLKMFCTNVLSLDTKDKEIELKVCGGVYKFSYTNFTHFPEQKRLIVYV